MVLDMLKATIAWIGGGNGSYWAAGRIVKGSERLTSNNITIEAETHTSRFCLIIWCGARDG